MKIGKTVQYYIKKINAFCEEKDNGEFEKLLDINYCKSTFNISYPFYKYDSMVQQHHHHRFWVQTYTVRGKDVRITNDWYSDYRKNFIEYLTLKGIAKKDDFNEEGLASLDKDLVNNNAHNIQNKILTNGRYKGNAISNASNLLVRNILSNLGAEQFSKQDWIETKQHFKNCCAYCGEQSKNLIMEHAVPINKKSLGEHRLGNIVPSCKKCNHSKSNKSFIEFLDNDNERIEIIKKYMGDKNYVPLGENEQVKMILEMAYKEVSLVSSRYIQILNGLV